MSNWLDDAIAFVSPEWGARRMAWRASLNELRNYDAGSFGRLNAGWQVVNRSAEETDRWSRDVVRARARDLERNSDVMNSILGANKRNVIGAGFRLQAMTESEKINDKIEKLWKTWCRPKNCDVTGQQSFTQLLRMAVARKKIDGGILIVRNYTDVQFPLQLQLLEVDELDGSHDMNGRTVGGIEYNEYNRPMGYWVKEYTLDGVVETQPRYISARDVIFYYTKRRPSQLREMSDMSQTLTRIRDLNEFITSVSVKQRVLACLSVFIKKTIPAVGLGRQNRDPERVSYDGKSLTPGMIKELNAGDDVQVVNPTGQSSDATSFAKLQQRMIAAGQGISYEATSRDMSETSYSSARQGMIEDELTFDEEYEQLVQVMDQIYEWFIDECFRSGLIRHRGYSADRERFLEHEWIRQPKAWIDPLKEANATMVALGCGIKTFKQVAAESGRDWKAQIDDMAEVNEYAESKGLDLKEVLFSGKLTPEKETGADAGTEKEGDGSDGAKERVLG